MCYSIIFLLLDVIHINPQSSPPGRIRSCSRPCARREEELHGHRFVAKHGHDWFRFHLSTESNESFIKISATQNQAKHKVKSIQKHLCCCVFFLWLLKWIKSWQAWDTLPTSTGMLHIFRRFLDISGDPAYILPKTRAIAPNRRWVHNIVDTQEAVGLRIIGRCSHLNQTNKNLTSLEEIWKKPVKAGSFYSSPHYLQGFFFHISGGWPWDFFWSTVWDMCWNASNPQVSQPWSTIRKTKKDSFTIQVELSIFTKKNTLPTFSFNHFLHPIQVRYIPDTEWRSNLLRSNPMVLCPFGPVDFVVVPSFLPPTWQPLLDWRRNSIHPNLCRRRGKMAAMTWKVEIFLERPGLLFVV